MLKHLNIKVTGKQTNKNNHLQEAIGLKPDPTGGSSGALLCQSNRVWENYGNPLTSTLTEAGTIIGKSDAQGSDDILPALSWIPKQFVLSPVTWMANQ